MFYIYVKRYYKNPVIILSTLILLVWISYMFFLGMGGFRISEALGYLVSITPVAFFIFMVISYEFFYQQKKSRLEEVIGSDRWGNVKENSMIFLIMVMIDIIATVMVLAFLKSYYNKNNVYDSVFWAYNVRATLIYFTSVMLFGILVGCIVSHFRKRMFGICVIIAVYYLFDVSFLSFAMGISSNIFPLWRFFSLFFLFFQSVHADCGYFLSAENVNIYRVVFWISAALAVVLWKKLHRKFIAVISLVVSAVCLGLFFMPSGASYGLSCFNGYDDSYHDQIYYNSFFNQRNKNYVDTSEYAEKDRGDFLVEKYDMDIRVSDIIESDVTVTPDKHSLSSYQFTLYHGYKVSSVSDGDGMKLRYKQESDFVEIYSGGKSLSQIRIEYSGYSPWFYSTTQGLYLPGNFAYYPMAGWKKIYNENGEILSKTLEKDAEFDVDIQCKYPLYSNFKVTEYGYNRGYYSWKVYGTSDALSLLGNPYLEETYIDGVRVVYSKFDDMQNPKTEIEMYREMFSDMGKLGYDIVGKTVLTDPHMLNVLQNCCIAKDHVAAYYLDLPNGYEQLHGGDNDGEQIEDY